MKRMLIISILALFNITLRAQIPGPPEVGKRLPDYMLNEVTHYSKSSASFREFEGTWSLIVHWYAGCRVCIRDLPRLDKIQKELGNELRIVLVGCSHPSICFGDGVRDTYEGLRKRLSLEMISAYDSVIVKAWGWYAFPRMIIADPNGIVRAITNGQDLTAEKLKALMGNQPVTFHDPDADDEMVGEGRTIVKSVLREWNGERTGGTHSIDEYLTLGKSGFFAPKASLIELYNTAYAGMRRWFIPRDSLYGIYTYYPEIRTKNLSAFRSLSDSSDRFYYYELDLANEHVSREDVMLRMQEDLKRAFGFEVAIERREMPVWKLVATEKARKKLVTAGGKPFFSEKGAAGGVAGFTLRNSRMNFFMALITKYINEYKYPYLDETGISSNIDITFDALLMDFDQVKRELNRNGLDLVLDKKMFNVIVISDPK
jgi:AhpC/TSA family./Protein of unknown function (DUF3738).